MTTEESIDTKDSPSSGVTSLGRRIATSPLFDSLRSRYLAVVQTIEDDVSGGRLRPGDRLPTQRELAAELGTAIGTVTRAYTEAKRRGLISGEVGRGTFVAMPQSVDVFVPGQPRSIDLRVIRIVPEPGIQALSTTLKSLAGRPDMGVLLGYQEAAGRPHHRAAGAAWIARTGLEVPQEQILVCNGAQHAMSVALGTLASPGDLILTEELNYPGIRLFEKLYHLRIQGVPCDRRGMSPDALENLCEATGARILLCTPTAHNPTNATMPPERRRRIAEIASQRDLTIIENDPYALLEPDPLLPISALVPERSCYITTASKTISAGLRVGYLATPQRIFEQAVSVLQATLWMTSPLLAELFSIWIGDGTANRILQWHRAEAHARQQIAASYLRNFEMTAHPFGYQIWLHLPEPWRELQFVGELARLGVLVSPADNFMIGRGQPTHAIRITLGGVQSREELERGLEVVAEVAKSGPLAQRAIA